ncbi:hypothetical protein ACF8C6_02900 [Pseudomonas sp. zbq_18]|uniref:hypothetical protein n=1 Tax=Pseudomonas sp. zbq_18 TaxID=3367251 RepID=UPI00370C0A45
MTSIMLPTPDAGGAILPLAQDFADIYRINKHVNSLFSLLKVVLQIYISLLRLNIRLVFVALTSETARRS